MSDKFKLRFKADLLAFTEWFRRIISALVLKVSENSVVAIVLAFLGTGFGVYVIDEAVSPDPLKIVLESVYVHKDGDPLKKNGNFTWEIFVNGTLLTRQATRKDIKAGEKVSGGPKISIDRPKDGKLKITGSVVEHDSITANERIEFNHSLNLADFANNGGKLSLRKGVSKAGKPADPDVELFFQVDGAQ
jgi:hypothetical protein